MGITGSSKQLINAVQYIKQNKTNPHSRPGPRLGGGVRDVEEARALPGLAAFETATVTASVAMSLSSPVPMSMLSSAPEKPCPKSKSLLAEPFGFARAMEPEAFDSQVLV